MPRINWLNVLFILGFPLYGFIQAYWVPLQTKTAIWAVFYYFYTGIGITAGYHRLWAHKAYTATLPLRIWLSLAGAGAVQGSILWWARSHRAHHRYTDTDADPYSIHKGLFHAHFGWMLIIPPQDTPSRISTRHTNISDLTRDAVVTWQHTHYLSIVLVMSLILPTTVAGVFWHDWWGGFIYAGILRTFAIQQATFCVNSLAHWIGDQPFDDKLSPRDHLFTALVTFGEGYHNFHHEFPGDYRNGVRWGQYDPTKWVIALCAWVGLARGLRVFGQNEIEMGRVQMLEKVVGGRKKMVNWGVGLGDLPVLDWGDVSRVTDGTESEGEGKQWIVIHGVVYDVQGFMDDHPGGRALISAAVGKDVTDLFTGGVYAHSNAAHNLLRSMRVGLLRK